MRANKPKAPPTNEKRNVGRGTNASYRKREYLTEPEIGKLIEATRNNRYPARDAALVLTMFRHGLRASEAASLEWSQIDWKAASLAVTRAKHGKPATHPIRGDELRRLRALQRDAAAGPWVFQTERGGQFTADAINRLVKALAVSAGLPFPCHAHMLRHATGYALANAGHDTRAIQDYLGHVSIQHTVRYTELNSAKFKGFFR